MDTETMRLLGHTAEEVEAAERHFQSEERHRHGKDALLLVLLAHLDRFGSSLTLEDFEFGPDFRRGDAEAALLSALAMAGGGIAPDEFPRIREWAAKLPSGSMRGEAGEHEGDSETEGERPVTELGDLFDTLARGNLEEIRALEGPLRVRVPPPGEGGNVEAIADDFRAMMEDEAPVRMRSARLPREAGGWPLLEVLLDKAGGELEIVDILRTAQSHGYERQDVADLAAYLDKIGAADAELLQRLRQVLGEAE